MVEIIDGKLTGTVEIPVENLSVGSVIVYCGDVLDGMTIGEVAKLLGTSKQAVGAAFNNAKSRGKTFQLSRGLGGRPKGRKTEKIVICEDDPIPTVRIKTYMMCRNEDVTAIAKVAGVPYATAYNWTHKKPVVPSVKYLTKLADHWGTTSAYLAGETNNPYRRF